MPKNKAQRRIDKAAGSGARTINIIGGSSGGDSAAIGQHSLSGNLHTGKLAEAQAPWAVTDTEFSAHTSNANAHHARRHSVLSTSDHTITADAFALLGATTTDTLGLLYIASSGDGIDVSKSSATFTIAVDVSDFDGAGLGDDGSNNLYVKTAEGVKLNGDNVTVDEAYAFAWTNDHTHTSTVGSPTFASGFTGSGWRIDTSAASLELNDLTVRGRMSVYELLLRQIRATNGNVFVSDAAKIDTVSGTGPYTLSVADDDVHGFAVGDLIRAQRFNGDGVYQSNMQVTSVTDTQTFVASLTSGDAPAAGMDFVRLGNVSDSGRRGSIYLSSADTYAPYIDVVDGVDAFTDWNSTDVLKMRMGRLDGITDPDFGVLSGYGLYVKGGGYFKGDVVAASADAVLNTYGLNLAAAGASVDNTGPSAISWTSTPLEPTAATLTGHISSSTYDVSGTVYNSMAIGVPFGTTTLTDEALMGLYLTSSDDSGDNLYFLLETTGTINGGAESWSGRRAWLGADNFFVQARTVAAGDIVPFNDGAINLGTASSRWGTLYVDEIVAGTTSSTDTGHNHDDRYYTQAQIDSQATGYAAASHTHASYINSATLASELASYVTSSSLTTTLAGYYTEAEADALLANKSSTGHTHDDRYYTEAEIDATLAGYSATEHTHDDRYYTETEIDALLATGVTAAAHDVVSTHTVTAAQYAVLSTWGAANTLSMVTATADGSAGHKLLKTDANGDLALNDVVVSDITGANGTFSGYLTSDDYVSGSAGFYIDGTGAEFGKLTARGAFRSAVFEVDSTAVFSNRQLIVKSSGTLAESIAIATSGGTEYQLKIAFPPTGEFPVAAVGDVLRIHGIAAYTATTASGNSVNPVWQFWRPQILASGLTPVDIWFTVTGINKGTGSYTYTCDWEHGNDNVTILAGEAIAVYGQDGDGVIESIATGPFAPYINIATHNGAPWTDEKTHVRIGQLGGLGSLDLPSTSWGGYFGEDASDAYASYILAATEVGVRINNGDILISDNGGPFVEISRANGFLVHANQLFGDLADGDTLGARLATNNTITFADKRGVSLGRVGYTATQAEAFGSYTYDYQGSYVVLEANWYQPSQPEPIVEVGEDEDDTIIYDPTLPGGARLEIATRNAADERNNRMYMDAEEGILQIESAYPILYGRSSTDIFGDDAVTIRSNGYIDINAPQFRLSNLPTSSSGLPPGTVWSDGGTLKIVS